MRTSTPRSRLPILLAAAASAALAALIALAWAGSYVRAAVWERKSGWLQPPPGAARVPLPRPIPGAPPPPMTRLAPGQPVWTFHAITTTLVSRRGVVTVTRADALSLAARPEELAPWHAHAGWSAGFFPATPARERTARWLYDGPTQWRAAGFGCYEVGIGGAIARVVHVPHWFLVGLAASPAAGWWAIRWRRRRRARAGRCPRCGYSLAGLPEGAGCPECGRAEAAP